jgi:N-acetylmuramoyl-L-alanine amidase
MKIENHLLLDGNITRLECPKNTGKFQPGLPDTLIMHYTAGRDAESSARYLCKDGVKASAHLVIGRNGNIFQLLPFDTVAWHAGRSQHGNRNGLNKYSIGIEMDNPGLLMKTEQGYKTWFGSEVPANLVVKAKHRNEKDEKYWHTYTEAQLMACEEICGLLLQAYEIKYILGHEEIAPGRKTDPGPAFPLDKLRSNLLHADREREDAEFDAFEASVIPSLLNIRSGPATRFEPVAEPLEKGTKLTVVGEKNGWYKVESKLEGWVSKNYVVKE